LIGLQPGAGKAAFHSSQELNLLVAESQQAGLLNVTQQVLVERVSTLETGRLQM